MKVVISFLDLAAKNLADTLMGGQLNYEKQEHAAAQLELSLQQFAEAVSRLTRERQYSRPIEPGMLAIDLDENAEFVPFGNPHRVGEFTVVNDTNDYLPVYAAGQVVVSIPPTGPAMIGRPDQNKSATFSIVQKTWINVCGPQSGGGNVSCVAKLVLSPITTRIADGGDATAGGFHVRPDGTFS